LHSKEQLKALFGEQVVLELPGHDIGGRGTGPIFTTVGIAFKTAEELKEYRQDRAKQRKTNPELSSLKSKLPVGFCVMYNIDTEHMKIDADVGEWSPDGRRVQ
jgi:hypothetical protein